MAENLSGLQLLEQMATTLENMGAAMAQLYRKLLVEGIPPDLAAKLVRDWWNIYWENLLETTYRNANQ